MSLKAFLVTVSVTYGAMFACADAEPPDVTAPPIPSTVYPPITVTSPTSTSTSTTSTTSTTTFAPIVFPETPCQEWAPTAVDAGWPPDPVILHRLLSIMWRESRCDPSATSRDDDRGLLQIHTGSWCRPNQYNETGWLQTQGIVESCDDLWIPLVNLRAARALYLYSEARGDAWRPWALTR